MSAIGRQVILPDGVEAAKLDLVHADLFGHAGDVGFQPKEHLGITKTAVSSSGREVCIDADGIDGDVVDLIRTDGAEAHGVHHIGAVFHISSRVPVDFVVESGDAALFIHSHPDFGHHSEALVGVDEFLFTGVAKLDGIAFELGGQGRGDDFHGHAGLASKASSHVGSDHADVLVAHAKSFGKEVTLGVGGLG